MQAEIATESVPPSAGPSAPRAPRPRREGLSDARKRDAVALAEALWSRDGETPPPRERLIAFAADLSDFVGHLNTRARLLFLTCLATITWIAPLLVGRMPHLGRLPLGERVRAVRVLETSPASLALFATKAIVSLVWFDQRENAIEIGWDQRCKTSRSGRA